jgi:hypothetical protein
MRKRKSSKPETQTVTITQYTIPKRKAPPNIPPTFPVDTAICCTEDMVKRMFQKYIKDEKLKVQNK